MNYLDLKRTVLQKVFAITDGKVVQDDTTQEYLTALPAAANEGLQRLATVGRFLKRCVCIVHAPDAPEDAEPTVDAVSGVMTILRPTEPGQRAYDLSRLLDDFYSLDGDGVYFTAAGGAGSYRNESWQMQGGQILFLAADTAGTWTIWYNAYPKDLTVDTPDEYELPLYPEVAVLLPLYIASQVYKDDDIGVATQYRNEFEVGLEGLRGSNVRGIQGDERFFCASGWWNYCN